MGYVAFVDISENQGHVDFARMYAQGVRYAILRAGINGRYDARLVEYVDGCRAAGLTIPALYWFCNPRSSASPEIQGHLLAAACIKHGVHTAMLDCEWYSAEGGPNPLLSPESYVSWLNRMRSVVERELGSKPIVYTAASFWDSSTRGAGAGAADDFADCDVILAGYPGWRSSGDPIPDGVHPDGWALAALAWRAHGPGLPRAWDHWDAWQFSAGYNRQGPVYGCTSGDLDLNFAQPGVIDRWVGGSTQPVPATPPEIPVPAPTPAPAPTPKPVWANAPEEDDMASRMGPFFIQATGADGHLAGRVYLCDGRGMELRQIETPARFDHARWLLTTAGYDHAAVYADPTPADDVEAYGHVVNP